MRHLSVLQYTRRIDAFTNQILRPLIALKPLQNPANPSIIHITSLSTKVTMSIKHTNQAKAKKPALTHFLCLPLVSESSLPFLESSINQFKQDVLLQQEFEVDHVKRRLPSLFPGSAIRPLGTLHLTLGVMSLTSPTRLAEAIEFLNSLDTEEILREVENILEIYNESKPPGRPITVSLESLSSLPKPRASTVLYAIPVDPTSRLYPFAVKIRQAFVEAGFIEQDVVKQKSKGTRPGKQNDNNNKNLDENIVNAERTEDIIIQQQPKFRPLLLHATIVNTVYARRGGKYHSKSQKQSTKRRGPLTFDARNLLSRYRDYYIDSTRTQRKQGHLTADDEGERRSQESDSDCVSRSSEEETHPSKGVADELQQTSVTNAEKHPFIWAPQIPIERLQICEMGAKTVTEEENHLAARLGQEYRIVAEKKLL